MNEGRRREKETWEGMHSFAGSAISCCNARPDWWAKKSGGGRM